MTQLRKGRLRAAASLITVGLIGSLTILGSGVSQAAGIPQAAGIDVHSVVDLGKIVQRTDPFALGFGSSTYGATPLFSAAQRDAEQRLDARYVRVPVGFRNGRVTTSAAGTSGTLDVPALVALYKSWGYRVLIVIGGRTNDTNVEPGDTTQIVRALGVGSSLDYSAPNEPNNRGQSVQRQVDVAKMILREGKALHSEFTLWGPVWTHYDRATMRTFAAGVGADLGGVDYHHYAMGSTSLSTAEALRSTPTYGQEIREVKADLAALGRPAPVNVDELNFSWRYQDGTPGGNNRFFTAVNTVWMTSALGHILSAGGRGLPYASQNGPLGIMVEAGAVNPDGRAPNTPMPAYWGIASWTGAKIWPHYKDTVYETTTSDPTGEVFAVNNESGGYNIIAINKSESSDKQLSLDLRNAGTGTYTAYQSNPAAPYDAPARVLDGDYAPGATESLRLPRMSVTVLVMAARSAPPLVAKVPAAPGALAATVSTDRTSSAVSWQPPASDGGSPVTGYRVARDGTDSTGGGTYATTLPNTARSFGFSLLRPQDRYTFTVQAVTAVGAGPAATVTTRPPSGPTAPAAPSAVSAARQQRGTRAVVAWQPPPSDDGAAVTGYRVTRSGSDSTGGGAYSTVVSAKARAFTFTLLSRTSPYTISVQAVNRIGTGPAGSVLSPAE